ncbi:DEAD/DEAH box helicase family protein [Nocardia uniformis]|uniref:DEAD/DEAH box helicase family protein n=1 Tax=Nocardia uniformis TaxID=53432 RepID=A0A849CHA0_9NOCA|nr:DEAD/DEAH box helicase family protein [Nocardia uniformis]NNH73001.1 DEAD/DEAH box helicase family protein [Nocardia uniformis]
MPEAQYFPPTEAPSGPTSDPVTSGALIDDAGLSAVAAVLAGSEPDAFAVLGRDAYRAGRTNTAEPIDPAVAAELVRLHVGPDRIIQLLNDYLRGWQEAAADSQQQRSSISRGTQLPGVEQSGAQITGSTNEASRPTVEIAIPVERSITTRPESGRVSQEPEAASVPEPAADATQDAALPAPVDFVPGTQLWVPSQELERAHANLRTIEVLRVLDAEDRYATPEEQQVIAAWSGWGALPGIFTDAPEWATEHSRLSKLLDTSEWAHARASTLNAHYTDPAVSQAIWDAMQRAGFAGGRVLEPGCGSGVFIGQAPPEAVMVGVECDPTTARAAAALYPSAQIRCEGFEDTRVEAGAFTAAIGNVPFGKTRLYDPIHNAANFSIHNHFLVKSLDLVGVGGYVAVLTSHFTSETRDTTAREQMASRADLVGAIRLPAKAFQRVAGTGVVQDLLIWRVREPGREPTTDTRLYLQSGMTTVRDEHGYRRETELNKYFLAHPDHILGELCWRQRQYNRDALDVEGPVGEELARLVTGRLTRIVDNALDADLGLTATPESTVIASPDAFGAGLVTPVGESVEVAVDTLRWNKNLGRIEVYTGTNWTEAPVRAKRRIAEWRELLGLRDVAATLVQAQLEGRDHTERSALRGELNRHYDRYLTTYGFINRFTWIEPPPVTEQRHRERVDTAVAAWRAEQGERGHPYSGPVPDDVLERITEQAWEPEREPFKKQTHLEGVLRNDPTIALVFALEVFDEESGRAIKGPLFTSDVIATAAQPITRATTIEDAVAVSLDETGVIDVPRIARLLAVSTDDTEQQLVAATLAFRSIGDPDTWISAASYLSGNVHTKLRAATTRAETDPRYRANIEALTAVLPQRRTDVDIRLGAVWVPPQEYAAFIRETFSIPAGHQVLVERVAGEWVIDVPEYDDWQSDLEKWGLAPKIYPNQDGGYNFDDPHADELGVAHSGVAGRNCDHIEILTSLCNSKPIQINKSKDFHAATGGDKLHSRATRAAQAKARRLATEFEMWALQSDPARRERLIDRYNELFNTIVAPEFDGSHLRLPGLGVHYAPYPYQRNAVARIISEPTVLLDHVVGAGKTGTMIMAAMELRRLGLARQPWIVVPNHLIAQMAREAAQWYPGAKILAGTAGTDRESRQRLIAQSTAQDWDVVIVPMSSFKLMPVSAQTRTAYYQEQIDELTDALGVLSGKKAVKILELRLKTATNQLKKLLAEIKSDSGLGFEASGCDYLFVDEAHAFKNLLRVSNIDELACAPGSQQAQDLLLKLEYLRGKRRREATAADIPEDAYIERVATFATGTPLSNSLSELWVMNRYLRPDLLRDAGVEHLDSWGGAFTATRETIELNSSGTRFQPKTRVAEFVNVGDLIAMTSAFTDSVSRDQIPATLPELRSGERTVVSFEPPQEVADFITDLGFRADRFDPKRPDIDNPLKVATDGRNATLDPRTAHLRAPDTSELGRLRSTVVAERILATYAATKDNVYLDPETDEPSPIRGGLQIVFCDRATPKTDHSTWSIYDALRHELIAGGIPAERIAFIHDYPGPAAKTQLFTECRSGKIAVLLGSTEKMGTGANIQTRAVALHHVDVPWRPADLEQREGRIVRQGNQNPIVDIFCYVAEKTFDIYMWQTVERKAHFIDQYRRADRSARRVPDLGADDLAENAAMIKAVATGDQRYVRRIELEQLIGELQIEQDSYFAATRSRERELIALRAAIPAHEKAVFELENITVLLDCQQETDTKPPVVIGDTSYDERPEASAALIDALRDAALRLRSRPTDEAITIGAVSGVEVEVRYNASDSLLHVKPFGLPVLKTIEHESLYLDTLKTAAMSPAEHDAAQARLASGIMTRVENLIADLPKALDNRRWDLNRDRNRLHQLETEPAPEFTRRPELKQLHVELDALERDLRNEATSPEALARRRALDDRLAARSRRRGWSLMLNATPAFCRHLGYDNPDQVRALMRKREQDAHLERLQQQEEEHSCASDAGVVAATVGAEIRGLITTATPQGNTNAGVEKATPAIHPITSSQEKELEIE